MKKIIVFNMVSVDGYFAGPNGEIDWHNVDAEFNEFATKQLTEEAGMLLFGRITYELMANYWPTEQGLKDDILIAGLMNSANKVVFSKSLNRAEWENTRLIKEITVGEIEKLKQETNKNIFVFGSGQVVQELSRLGLVDEYRLMVNPITLGQGKPLFKKPIRFKLNKLKEFKSGNILTYYEPIK